ncbi:MAG TPA: SDR family NAD(P)-dependent oxidoreductase [Mucilaginibacter sp.]|nr:SDR family NAD(P)-dependent oxidoreductase [Mucilaginibacter sp.]
MKITGNTILITGGTSGIGLSLAEKLLAQGNKVIITGRRANRLNDIKARLPEIIIKESDVADAGQRVELKDWISKNHPDMNMLINNAGVQLVFDLKTPIDPDRVHSETETNFVAPVHLSTLFVPLLTDKADSAIINVTSGLVFVPVALMPVYCATKAAMHSFTLSLRYQLKDTAIKVFEIIPPQVDTELGHDRRADKNKSHGGMPPDEFVGHFISAIQSDELEAAIGAAEGLRQQRETIFERFNDSVVLI